LEDLEQSSGLAHGGFQMKRPNVLPILLQERNQEVDGHHSVGQKLIRVLSNVTDSDSHAQDLLQLELDGGFDISNLVGEIFGVRNGCRELASLR